MLKSIAAKARNLRLGLTRLDSQPLGKAALAVIIFLDLFILISIFDGLAEHVGQLSAPETYIPQHCRDIVIDAEWNETNRLGKLARIVAAYHGSYYAPDEKDRKHEQHRSCAPITRMLWTIEDDEGLSKNLAETGKLQQQAAEVRLELERVKGAYDTTLLEVTAGQRPGRADVAAIRKEIADKTEALNGLLQRLRLFQTALEQDGRVRELFALIAGISETERVGLRNDLRNLHFWQPVKRLGMEMAFLLPLFLVFYFWNSRSLARHRPLQTLVSSHLVVLVFIPVLFKLVELIYDIIPKKFLQHLIELLESLKLVALWHYLLMGIAILAALALVYLFQKKLFSREKLIEKRIANGLCQHCGRRLPTGCRACPFCGAGQYRVCGHCSGQTPVHGRHCVECGHAA